MKKIDVKISCDYDCELNFLESIDYNSRQFEDEKTKEYVNIKLNSYYLITKSINRTKNFFIRNILVR